jgi:hypothetical protein
VPDCSVELVSASVVAIESPPHSDLPSVNHSDSSSDTVDHAGVDLTVAVSHTGAAHPSTADGVDQSASPFRPVGSAIGGSAAIARSVVLRVESCVWNAHSTGADGGTCDKGGGGPLRDLAEAATACVQVRQVSLVLLRRAGLSVHMER